jgi:hypothetical protein
MYFEDYVWEYYKGRMSHSDCVNNVIKLCNVSQGVALLMVNQMYEMYKAVNA